MSLILNDIHSQLNATAVEQIVKPRTFDELIEVIVQARVRGLKISVAGGRHAMGGQQFASGSLHIDMTALDAVLGADAERGLIHIEAGAVWPAIIEASHRMDTSSGRRWGIRQKQTGVDDVSLGGSNWRALRASCSIIGFHAIRPRDFQGIRDGSDLRHHPRDSARQRFLFAMGQ